MLAQQLRLGFEFIAGAFEHDAAFDRSSPVLSLRRRAAIEDPPLIVKILAHLGLPTHAPPRFPAQRFDLFQTI